MHITKIISVYLMISVLLRNTLDDGCIHNQLFTCIIIRNIRRVYVMITVLPTGSDF